MKKPPRKKIVSLVIDHETEQQYIELAEELKLRSKAELMRFALEYCIKHQPFIDMVRKLT